MIYLLVNICNHLYYTSAVACLTSSSRISPRKKSFSEAWLSSGQVTLKAWWLVEWCRDGCPTKHILPFPHMTSGVSSQRPSSSLDKVFSALFVQFGWVISSEKLCLVVFLNFPLPKIQSHSLRLSCVVKSLLSLQPVFVYIFMPLQLDKHFSFNRWNGHCEILCIGLGSRFSFCKVFGKSSSIFMRKVLHDWPVISHQELERQTAGVVLLFL